MWLLALGLLLTSGAGAQTPADLSIEPAMVKGTLAAPVTIVEFSDYQ
jgi:protein-disulfide isomerase